MAGIIPKNLFLIGASGNVGSAVTKEIINCQKFNVKVLYRKDTTKRALVDSFQNDGATLVEGDADDEAQMTELLRGSDTVLSFLGGIAIVKNQTESKIVRAAKAAGVRRIFPSDYSGGSFNPNDPFFGSKPRVRQEIIDAGLEFTSVVTGGFYEFLFGVRSGFDPHNHRAIIAGDGNVPVMATDVPDIGKFVVAILLDPETRNKIVYAYAATFTYNELVKIFEEESGHKFDVSYESVESLQATLQNDPDFFKKLMAHIKILFATREIRESDVLKYNLQPLTIREKARQIYSAAKSQ